MTDRRNLGLVEVAVQGRARDSHGGVAAGMASHRRSTGADAEEVEDLGERPFGRAQRLDVGGAELVRSNPLEGLEDSGHARGSRKRHTYMEARRRCQRSR
jgi:hypothetical protein